MVRGSLAKNENIKFGVSKHVSLEIFESSKHKQKVKKQELKAPAASAKK